MRLRRLTVNNFRSIREIENFEFVDLGITTFVGGNGTGKSNILKSIYCLGEDEKSPSDDDFYAKGPGADDEISIEAEFMFEEADRLLLDSKGLSLNVIKGFQADVEKKRRENATISFSPIGYSNDKARGIGALAKRLAKIVGGLELPAEAASTRERILEAISSGLGPDSGDYEKNISTLSGAVAELKPFEVEGKDEILECVEKIIRLGASNLSTKLEEMFDGFDIELLAIEGYDIENAAPIAELADNSKHPFLYDLLVLAEMDASEFEPLGHARLARTEDSASEGLSQKISDVWPSHELSFRIARHGDDLLFTVRTPQGEQIVLTDLSDGEKWFLRFYIRLAIAERQRKQVLWLFDEPGRDLHSSSQVDLKRFFEEVSESCQIIYSTHQAMMVPWHRLERIFVVENLENEGTKVHRRFWKDAGLESPLKEALSTFVGEELFSGKEHIIVEGMSDYFYLQGWLRFFQKSRKGAVWRKNYEPLKRVILPVDGVGKMPLYCWFLGKETRNKASWVAVVDSKEDQETTRTRLEGTGLGSWKGNARCVGSLAKSHGAKEVEEIEGLFKAEEYFSVFEEYYREEYPAHDLPGLDEVVAAVSKGKKITKVITGLLQKKNPEVKVGGKPMELDKTGIARKVYVRLTQVGATGFCKETQSNFEEVLREVDKLVG